MLFVLSTIHNLPALKRTDLSLGAQLTEQFAFELLLYGHVSLPSIRIEFNSKHRSTDDCSYRSSSNLGQGWPLSGVALK